MKIVINPEYAHLSDSLRKIPDGIIAPEQVYQDKRNTVYSISCEGIPLVVKRFKVPNSFNRFAYSFLRHSKARRSFDYALRLQSLGIDTALPVAYIEISRFGLFHTSYFISECIEDKLLNTLVALDPGTRSDIIRDFCRFTVDMHAKGVLHKDFNIGNIFYREEDDHYRFAVIDINRMVFRAPRKKEVIRSFTQLRFPSPIIVEIISEYARLRGWNPDITSGAVLIRRGVDMHSKTKRALKKLVKPLKSNRNKNGRAL